MSFRYLYAEFVRQAAARKLKTADIEVELTTNDGRVLHGKFVKHEANLVTFLGNGDGHFYLQPNIITILHPKWPRE